jgi:hypothetical protein
MSTPTNFNPCFLISSIYLGLTLYGVPQFVPHFHRGALLNKYLNTVTAYYFINLLILL